MKCPNCNCEIETSQNRWQHRNRARGLCISCGKPADKREGKEYAKCLQCRRREALRRRRAKDVDGQLWGAQVHKDVS
jgi:uncharacterized C2H2 Zn-finger protein